MPNAPQAIPLVSVIVPTCNRPKALKDCLLSLIQQTYNALEIIVVDNSSEPEKSKEVVLGFTGVAYEFVNGAYGNPGVLRNIGARLARGKILVFTDDDCVAPHQWIHNLLMNYAEGVAGVGGRLIEQGRPVYADMPVGHLLPDGRVVGNWARDTEIPVQVQFLTGGNMSIHRAVFDALGGFDPAFGSMGYEEVDLGLRVTAAGHRLYFDPKAWVEHRPAPRPDAVGSRSDPLKDAVSAFILSRNVTYLMARHFGIRWDRSYLHNVYWWWLKDILKRLISKPTMNSLQVGTAVVRGLIRGTQLGWKIRRSPTKHMPV